MQSLPITNTLTIRECGFDEYWLQDQIVSNPNCLGLGDLDTIDKERQPVPTFIRRQSLKLA